MSFQCFLKDSLEKRKENNTYRKLISLPNLKDFTSNDYLGFARSQELCTAILQKCASTSSLGATGSRLLTGHSQYYEDLECSIAQTHHAENALIFNSGYTANLGLLSTIASPEDRFIHDLYIHASMHDGIRLSKARSFPFRHNDIHHLQQRLETPYSGRTFVCVESVYSLHGSVAPLIEIQELCERYEAQLIVDEAHALGIFGDHGEGLVTMLGLQDKVLATLYTFGKALGMHGAAIACSTTLKHYLINFCRPFIYTTALPSSSLISIDLAYQHNYDAVELRKHLSYLISFFRQQAEELGISLPKGNALSPIQSICIPRASRIRQVSQYLQESGFDVRPILSPTVRQNQELLRICIHTFNTEEEISQVLLLISQALSCVSLL